MILFRLQNAVFSHQKLRQTLSESVKKKKKFVWLAKKKFEKTGPERFFLISVLKNPFIVHKAI